MKNVRHKDSKAELALRRQLHALGLRYRLHVRAIKGCPDLAIQHRKIAIFVDGDMWHGNPRLPEMRGRSNFAALFPQRTDWWLAKIGRNVDRDRVVNASLKRDHWLVIRVWESDIHRNPVEAAERVIAEIEASGR